MKTNNNCTFKEGWLIDGFYGMSTHVGHLMQKHISYNQFKGGGEQTKNQWNDMTILKQLFNFSKQVHPLHKW